MLKIKKIQRLSWQRLLSLAGLGLLIVASLYYPLSAQSVSEGYNADQVLQSGLIVRLNKDDSKKVEPVTADDAENMHGVVINANDAAVTLASEGQNVFVATTGHYEVLVSTQSGKIKIGDFITTSAIGGIGAKASVADPYIMGRALADFDGSTNVVSSTEIKDNSGANHKVSIGRVLVDIGVAKNPIHKGENSILPSALSRAAETVAGKTVNTTRVYLSILVLGMTAVIVGSLLYGGVKSAIISIGRNPLSKKLIMRSMFQVVITGMIVFLVGVFGVYLILKL